MSSGWLVDQVWRYPVKSLGGERVTQSWVDERGLLGDRLWAVQDADGKLGSGKDSRRFTRIAGLLSVTASLAAEPEPTAGEPVLIEPPVVRGPDGSEYPVSTGAADRFLADFIGRPQVRVRRETIVSHFDEVPLSMIGTATVCWLQAELPELRIEPRRFRANIVVRTAEPFVEESWLGRTVTFGTGDNPVSAVFDHALERCVMVGMAQPGLAESGAVLKRIGRRDANPLCLAVGGQVMAGGLVRVNDPINVR